jgi:fibronectin type 3 domain-containing protein
MRLAAAFVILGLCWLACNGDENAGNTPFNLVVKQQGTAAALSWECNATPDHYRIQRSDDIDNSFRNWATAKGSQRYYYDYTVQTKHQYYYRVGAVYTKDGEPSEYTRSVGIYIE